MTLKRSLNRALTATTGLQVRRAPRPGTPRPAAAPQRPAPAYRRPSAEEPATDRLLRRPAFIVSSIRSGSTLLRLMLNAHSRLHSPHELHITRLEVGFGSSVSQYSMTRLGLERGDLEHLLWDRLMHWELVRSGKDHLVEKTPGNVFDIRRVRDCWPDARFVFLLRHPESVARSWHESDPEKRPYEKAVADALRYVAAVDDARKALPGGCTVRYEDITEDPERQLRRLCAFLDVEYEPGMVDYGRAGGTEVPRGLGDWRPTIRTGTVQPGRALPERDEIHGRLLPMCEAWGYA
ncbi:sulfotransferase family protein [Streptomyces sp. bgisy154]|uniref:sulfotransferase family protein n=1 Tax=Streptomyces sp. bgisy154 TaxID=3413794 RepID=UPI003D738F02